MVMCEMDAEEFAKLCNGVWRDRLAILHRRGILSGETALVRAVYWRLRKSGAEPGCDSQAAEAAPTGSAYDLEVLRLLAQYADPSFAGGPILKELLERYAAEASQQVAGDERTAHLH
jgi:hypothetical protein